MADEQVPSKCRDEQATNEEREREIAEAIRRGMKGVEAGRTLPAKEALRLIAKELGLKLDRPE